MNKSYLCQGVRHVVPLDRGRGGGGGGVGRGRRARPRAAAAREQVGQGGRVLLLLRGGRGGGLG